MKLVLTIVCFALFFSVQDQPSNLKVEVQHNYSGKSYIDERLLPLFDVSLVLNGLFLPCLTSHGDLTMSTYTAVIVPSAIMNKDSLNFFFLHTIALPAIFKMLCCSPVPPLTSLLSFSVAFKIHHENCLRFKVVKAKLCVCILS